jgi:hypothetical protein
LPGQDVGKLIQAGWVPAALAVGLGASAIYQYAMGYQRTIFAGNIEVDVPTKAITQARAAARREFREHVRGSGADGGIVSDMKLTTWEYQENGVAAIATVFGTTIARFHRGESAPTSALTILPLNRI